MLSFLLLPYMVMVCFLLDYSRRLNIQCPCVCLVVQIVTLWSSEMLLLLPLLIAFSIFLVATTQQCRDGDIQITNGIITMDRDAYNIAGGLQICVNYTWATVCQNEWEDVDATVACRQLGLVYGGSKLSHYFKLMLFGGNKNTTTAETCNVNTKQLWFASLDC